MQTRVFGKAKLMVSELGFGCMGLTGFYGPSADEDEAIRVIHRAIDLGVTFFDTAESYGPFTNEKLVGRALKGRRDSVVIATKFGWEWLSNGERRPTSRPDHIVKVIDASLQRLQTDYIDLYYQHRLDPQVPIEETVGALAALVKQGKIRHIGLSEVGPQTIRRAHAVHPLTALQTEYSLWERGPEAEILPTLRELGIGFVAYSPLGRGFLTGEIKNVQDLAANDFRQSDPRFQGENFARNTELVERVKQLASQKGVTPGQIALAWLLHKGNDIVPIPGTKRLRYLEENIAASHIVLSAEEVTQLEASVGQTAGDRYSEAALRFVSRE
ncbi:oxidoreductase [Ktedonobacter sp. SOSP1-52]|uniref:aldo/keto reductase n=1 Tax=Ktedonobacter sp. SOSP1-52 TaxID=2778366 RepID=UPI00191689B9|nr:aldo/keto reductase [Ktedonobacter sp. SOSP1-52]GHO66784.1 oxidoreductase [Ktedonobacter sp. SOSP1-52]